MVKIVSIKFKDGGKPYFFAPNGEKLEKGDGVVVETAKGQEYAVVDEAEKIVEDNQVVQPLKPVLRKATERDLEVVRQNEERKGEAIKIFREKVDARQLGMKPIGCEFSFDQSKVTFYFTAESRVDFRELIRDLSYAFLMGGLGPCGRECCCMKALHEPKKVSVKMAKTQNLSLNPEKISGLCGRLMCCLSYENDYYAEVSKKMPKIGGSADTPDGKGTVINVNMFDMTVKVKIVKGEDIAFKDYPVDDIAFMKGNVLYGKVAVKEEKPEEKAAEADVADEEADKNEQPAETERQGKNRDKNRERRQGRDRNRERGKGERPAPDKNRSQGGEGNGQNAGKKNKNFKQNNNRPHGQNGGDENRKSGANQSGEKHENDSAAQGRENAFKEGRRSRNRHRGGRGNKNGNNNKTVESNEQLATANNKLASANDKLATANNKNSQKNDKN